MGWTKRQLISEAFGELALQGFEFDITPEEQQTALRRLDTMMTTWEGSGIRLGYLIPSSPDASSLDSPSGVPDSAVETVYLNLAIRMAPGFGKQVSSDTRKAAADGYDTLMVAAAMPQQQQRPSMPSGAGNKPWRSQQPFTPAPSSDPLGITQGGDLDFLSE